MRTETKRFLAVVGAGTVLGIVLGWLAMMAVVPLFYPAGGAMGLASASLIGVALGGVFASLGMLASARLFAFWWLDSG